MRALAAGFPWLMFAPALVLACAALGAVDSARAQDSVHSDTLTDDIHIGSQDYLISYGENAWRIFTGPARYDRADWINLGLVAGLTGALFLADETVADFWQEDGRGSFSDSLADGLENFGDSGNILLGWLGAYAGFEALGMKQEKAAALMSLESVLLTAPVIEGLKRVSGRVRPNRTDDPFDFDGLGGDSKSFPSGHAGNSFATAAVLSEVYGTRNPWVPWLSYATATGVALSQINDNEHWASDVFLGGAIGLFVGKMVARHSPFLVEHDISLRSLDVNGGQGIVFAFSY